MLLRIEHTTDYFYSAEVHDNQNELRVIPRTDLSQTLEAFTVEIEPSAGSMLKSTDFYHNPVMHFHLNAPPRVLKVFTRSVVRTKPWEPDFSQESSSAQISDEQAVLFYDFLHPSKRVEKTPEIWRFALDAIDGASPLVSDRAERICQAVHDHCTYLPGTTTIATSAAETLLQQKGVCQDFAHLMIATCRAVAIPARYVSGYFLCIPGDSDDGGATHAWMEYFAPGLGWIGFDPTHNRRTDERYVKLAIGRDYTDVRPIAGSYRGNAVAAMKVNVCVNPLDQQHTPSLSA